MLEGTANTRSPYSKGERRERAAPRCKERVRPEPSIGAQHDARRDRELGGPAMPRRAEGASRREHPELLTDLRLLVGIGI
jgi:hypothetical protein